MKATYPTLFNILGIALEMVLLEILKKAVLPSQ